MTDPATSPDGARSLPGTTRDRDAAGRARNSRPRDGLGRPLPHGVPGVPTTPDDLRLDPAAALAEAQRLLDTDRPFHAHEVLEASWKAAPDAEREFWRGLAQLAVGLTHARRGNTTGAASLLHRAADRLEPYAATALWKVPVKDLVAWTRDLAARIDAGDTAALPTAPPRLTPAEQHG